MHVDLIKNKYTAWYLEFIEFRRYRKLVSTLYSEKHHILPRSLGGSDSVSNVVILTAREHYIAHLLLARMFGGASKIKAAADLYSMRSSSIAKCRLLRNSRELELIKFVNARLLKKLNKECTSESEIQERLLHEEINIDQLLIKGCCKICGIKPRGINYYKNNKVFYRSTCDTCAKKPATETAPHWQTNGYRKKAKCECCGFSADFNEQLTVIEHDTNYKTVCLNCEMAAKLGKFLKFSVGDLRPDF